MKSKRKRLAVDGLWAPTIDALFAAAVVCFNAMLTQLLESPAPTAVFAVLFAAFVLPD